MSSIIYLPYEICYDRRNDWSNILKNHKKHYSGFYLNYEFTASLPVTDKPIYGRIIKYLRDKYNIRTFHISKCKIALNLFTNSEKNKFYVFTLKTYKRHRCKSKRYHVIYVYSIDASIIPAFENNSTHTIHIYQTNKTYKIDYINIV